MTTQQATQPETLLEAAWRAVKVGKLTWDEVRTIQASLMPKCAAHDEPAIAKWYGKELCERCIQEGRHKR